MNTISASARPGRRPRIPSVRQMARKLSHTIAPRDHAGIGNWDNEADIPRVWAWAAGIAFAAFCLFGRQILAWLLSFAV